MCWATRSAHDTYKKGNQDARTSNCFSVDGKKGCNVGTPIRVSIHYNSSRTQPMADMDHRLTSRLPMANPTSCMSISGILTMAQRNGTAVVTDTARKSTRRLMVWVTRLVGSSRRAFPAIPSVWGLRLLARLRWSILGCFGGLILGVKVAWIE
jgi:hypothetical protein